MGNQLYINRKISGDILKGVKVVFQTQHEHMNSGRTDSIVITSSIKKKNGEIKFQGFFSEVSEKKVEGMFNPATKKGWLEYA